MGYNEAISRFISKSRIQLKKSKDKFSRDEKAIKLLSRGYSFKDVARILGYSSANALSGILLDYGITKKLIGKKDISRFISIRNNKLKKRKDKFYRDGKAIKLLLCGYSYATVAKKLGYSSERALSGILFHDYDITKTTLGLREHKYERDKKAIKLLKLGYSFKDVARILGYSSANALTGILSYYGITKKSLGIIK